MRYVIIEDEAPAQAQLEADVRELAPDAELVACYATVREALVGLPTCRDLDVVLCDVQLADGSCFEIFEAYSPRCPVIFCTAYDEYVMQALSGQGIDYLLKPIEKRRLAQALAKLRGLQSHFLERIEGLARELASRKKQTTSPRRVLAKQGALTVALEYDDITYFGSEDKTVIAVTRDGGRYLVDGSLADAHAGAPEHLFFRANRRFIVHVGSVKNFRSAGHGRLAVSVAGVETPVVVSQDNARAFRDWLEGVRSG